MDKQILPAAQRTPYLVSRKNELQKIQNAIYKAPQNTCQIVLIKGKGGIGKSRLAEEVLWRGGNWRARKTRGPIPVDHPEWDWAKNRTAVIGDLIDMAATERYARVQFMQTVRDALVWPGSGVDFPHYDPAFNRFQGLRVFMGDYPQIRTLEKTAEDTFIQDFQEKAQDRRIVLILDTIERLFPIGGTEWLLKRGLLTSEDMAFYTYQWLLDHIRRGTFTNTTLLLLGRDEEGSAFFDAIEIAANADPNTFIHLIEIAPFSLDDTKAFLKELAEDTHFVNPDQILNSDVSETIKLIAKDEPRIKTLWIYTDGQPVRLSLYTDLIVEAQSIPDRLQDSPEDAEQAIQEGTLKGIQEDIEASFVDILFSRPSLSGEVLKALVRAPRGLDADQLSYALFSKPLEQPKEWQERARKNHSDDSDKIQDALEALKKLSIVKMRPNGRFGLQDEIYRIYAHHLAKTEKSCIAEQDARQKLHSKLETWAHFHHEMLLKELVEIQSRDERLLKITVPSRTPEDVRFPTLTELERSKRNQLRNEIEKWKLEGLHYALLRDFVHNFNHVAFEQADQERIANNPGGEALIQAELWQVLKDPAYALRDFGKLERWIALEKHDEHPLDALTRIALQEDIANWIKRFVFRKEYIRALEFYDSLEKVLQETYSPESKIREVRSWHHTFSVSRSHLWRDYARLFLGMEVEKTLRGMEEVLQDLNALLKHSQKEVALEDRGECGFRGHPAEPKLKRIVALYHNYIGYGYAQQGHFKKAKQHYGKALSYMRETEFPHMVPTTANNLARVLSDRGYNRSRRICLDALELRKEQGAEVPIAYSYNTLALIDNDHNRPDLAWIESAIAIAYFRMAKDSRGLGLSLLQLGEALRRMAKPTSEAHHLRGDDPELILEIAVETLNEAVTIFIESEERLRLVEAWLERGCMERDRIQWTSDSTLRERHYRDALSFLDQSIQLAQEIKNKRLELDAAVNIAWTHYYFGDIEQTIKTLDLAESLPPNDSRIREEVNLPLPDRDDLYNFQQLSKLNGLRARIAMDRFKNRVGIINDLYPDDPTTRRKAVHEDTEAKTSLKQAAEYFTLSLGYAQLLSPRSSALSMIYNSLYGYLKTFNLSEMADFSNCALEARKKYKINKLKITDLGKLDEFLDDSFGISH